MTVSFFGKPQRLTRGFERFENGIGEFGQYANGVPPRDCVCNTIIFSRDMQYPDVDHIRVDAGKQQIFAEKYSNSSLEALKHTCWDADF